MRSNFFLSIIFWTSCLHFCFSQSKDISFKKITGSQGLSQNTVMTILQDHDGFMWFGTLNGLNKWDGYSMKVYKNIPEDSNSLSNNDLTFIFEDSKKDLWIGTYDGLNRYNREKNNFKVYKKDPKNPGSISSNFTRTMYEDKDGNLWIGTVGGGFDLYDKENDAFIAFKPGDYSVNEDVNYFLEDKKGNFWLATGNGLALFNRKNKTFTHFYTDPENKELRGRYVTSLLEDQSGQIWVTTELGINIFDPKKNTYKHLQHSDDDPKSLGNNTVYCTLKDREGKIWVGTENGGLNLYNPKTNSFEHFYYDPNNPNSLSNNSVSCIYQDISGNFWIGVHRGGVNFFSPKGQKFKKYKAEPGVNNLSHNNIKAFQEDELGNIWIGTDGGGLNYFDRAKNTFTHYKHDPNNPKSIGSDAVISVCKDSKGKVWIGTWDGGLNLMDVESKTFDHYNYNPNDSSTLAYFHVWSILEDSKKRLWVGSYDGGLNLYDRSHNTFTRFVNNPTQPNSLISNKIFCLTEDKAGYLWIGTHAGLSRFDFKEKKFTNYSHSDKDSSSLSNNRINILFCDSKGRIWIGTQKGLNLYHPSTGTFSLCGVKYGLGMEVIQGILEDDKQNLWISTVAGLIKFNPDTDTYHKYTEADGLQSNEFSQNACMKSKSGELFFGGIEGFNIFHPDSIQNNSFVPPIRLTDFQIFNKSVYVGKNSVLKQDINETKEIVLSYQQSVFSFEFAALNYLASENNKYAYKLEGFDKHWNFVNRQRKATYTNIDPGTYVFKVKGSNNDGIWNEEGTSVTVIITPPYWKTWWFRLLAALFVIGSSVSFYFYRINTIKAQKAALEKQVHERTSEVVAQKEELQTQAENLQIAYDAIKTQEEKLEELYTDVKDSIKAAYSIQRSILPSKNLIQKYLPDSFVLYKPKDVVSGDFYWFDVINGQIIIGAVDCTGHGVSGAFMSINGFHLLNQCIYPSVQLTASDILNRLNENIIKMMSSDEDQEEGNYDGMDVSLCILSEDRKQLQFSGASNPIYILRGNELIQIKGNRYSIGRSITGDINTFTNHTFELQRGDILYLFSDGYSDQLGGTTGDEKFMYYRFRELLLKIGNEKMETQMKVLEENIERWRGSREQIDDILVMGFRI